MNSDPTPTKETVQKLEKLAVQQAFEIANLKQAISILQNRIRALAPASVGFGCASVSLAQRGV